MIYDKIYIYRLLPLAEIAYVGFKTALISRKLNEAVGINISFARENL